MLSYDDHKYMVQAKLLAQATEHQTVWQTLVLLQGEKSCRDWKATVQLALRAAGKSITVAVASAVEQLNNKPGLPLSLPLPTSTHSSSNIINQNRVHADLYTSQCNLGQTIQT